MASTVLNSTLAIGPMAVPVALRKISQKEDVKFGRATADGNKIKRVEIDETSYVERSLKSGAVKVSGILAADPCKGVWEGDEFRPITVEAIEAIEEATDLDSFEITDFIPLADVPWERVTDAYYLVPQRGKGSGAVKALATLQEAMRESGKAGIFKMVLRSRQSLAIVYAHDEGLFVNKLCFASDFAQADEAGSVFAGVARDGRAVGLAIHLIDAMTADDSTEALDSHLDDALVLRAQLVEEALAGKVLAAPKAKAKPATTTTDDALVAALEASLAAKRAEREQAEREQAPAA